jgi:RHS repeat-associated protein
MRFLLLFLTLVLQVNVSGNNAYNPQKDYAQKALTAKITEKQQLSIVTNYLGTPEAMYREDGEAVWTCELNSYGKVRNFHGEFKTDCPFRYQGQYEDSETGLFYNRFRYYDAEVGVYICHDPISIAGSLNIYAYVHDPNLFVDKFGLKPNANKPNQDVYALYRKGDKEPYYIGISQDADIRLKQHEKSGRFDPSTDEMRVLQRQQPYAHARAHEQFNIEKYNTIKKTNPKANHQNSFRKNRTDANGIEYKQEYDKLKKGGCH